MRLFGISLMVLAVLLLLMTSAAEPSVVDPSATQKYWQMRGCTHGHPTGTKKGSYAVVKRVLRNHQRLNKKKVQRLPHYAVCVATKKKHAAVWDFIRRSNKWRKQYAHFWPIKWDELPYYAKSWTAGVSSRESGSRIGETSYYKQRLKSGVCDCWSFFQWMHPTWYSACACSRSVFSASWYHQAVKAWEWHLSHPTGQWPNTGE